VKSRLLDFWSRGTGKFGDGKPYLESSKMKSEFFISKISGFTYV